MEFGTTSISTWWTTKPLLPTHFVATAVRYEVFEGGSELRLGRKLVRFPVRPMWIRQNRAHSAGVRVDQVPLFYLAPELQP
jgi:hypothetical protein